jgi:hypothetical protein
MANTHAGLMNNSILVREVTMKSWENLAIVSMKCSNSIKTMVSNFVVTTGPGYRFTKLYYETSRSCSRRPTRSKAISSMYAEIVLRELYGLVLNKRDILDDNSTAVA